MPSSSAAATLSPSRRAGEAHRDRGARRLIRHAQRPPRGRRATQLGEGSHHIALAGQHRTERMGGHRPKHGRGLSSRDRRQLLSSRPRADQIARGAADLDRGGQQRRSVVRVLRCSCSAPADRDARGGRVAAGELEQRDARHRVVPVAVRLAVVRLGAIEVATEAV